MRKRTILEMLLLCFCAMAEIKMKGLLGGIAGLVCAALISMLEMCDLDIRIFRTSYKRARGIWSLVPVGIVLAAFTTIAGYDTINLLDTGNALAAILKLATHVLLMICLYGRLRVNCMPNILCVLLTGCVMGICYHNFYMWALGTIIIFAYAKFQFVATTVLFAALTMVHMVFTPEAILLYVICVAVLVKCRRGIFYYGNYFQVV